MLGFRARVSVSAPSEEASVHCVGLQLKTDGKSRGRYDLGRYESSDAPESLCWERLHEN